MSSSTQLRDLLRDGDLELGVLTLDEVALLLDAESDPTQTPEERGALAAAARSLVARGLVEAAEDGVRLHGVVGLVRFAHTHREALLGVDLVRSEHTVHRRVHFLVDEVVLDEVVVAPGASAFTLRTWLRVLDEIARDLGGRGDIAGREAWQGSVDDDERLEQLRASELRAAVEVRRAMPNGQIATTAMRVAVDTSGSGWLITRAPGPGTVSVIPCDRKVLSGFLTHLVMGPVTDVISA